MRLVDTARTPSPRGIQWGQISISDQDAERTVPQTRQNGLPTSQPEECLQLAHLAYRADMKPEAILMIITEYCALPPLASGQSSANGQGNRSGKDQAHHIPHHNSMDKNKSTGKSSTPSKTSKSIRQQRNKRGQKVVIRYRRRVTQVQK